MMANGGSVREKACYCVLFIVFVLFMVCCFIDRMMANDGSATVRDCLNDKQRGWICPQCVRSNHEAFDVVRHYCTAFREELFSKRRPWDAIEHRGAGCTGNVSE